MRLDEDTLIEQLKLYAHTDRFPGDSSLRRQWKLAPPVTEAEMLVAEAKLGFSLPPLLRRLYLEVSNGDFGPGLRPLDGDDSLVFWYVEEHSMTQEELDAAWGVEQDGEWDDTPVVLPEKLLNIYDWGCNIYSYLDCSTPACPVLRNDNNISFRTFAREAQSLHEWLEAGLDGKQLFWLVDWDQAEKVTFEPHI